MTDPTPSTEPSEAGPTKPERRCFGGLHTLDCPHVALVAEAAVAAIEPRLAVLERAVAALPAIAACLTLSVPALSHPDPDGARLIAAERQRQITGEGYDAAHDAGHADELATAGATYALPTKVRHPSAVKPPPIPSTWPWSGRYWKPTPDDRIRELVKAGALIAAAIDSLSESGKGETE